jgi:hypothetical protein
MVLAAGAVLAVAACDGAKSDEKADKSVAQTEGIDPPWGDDPNQGPFKSEFTPDFITLVRISSKQAWDISSNHASFPVKGMSYDQRKSLAAEIFKHFKSGKIKSFADLHGTPDDHQIAQRKGGGYDRNDFNEFQFGSPHEIYIWFDNKDVSLLHPTGMNPHLISMSAKRADGTDTTKNKSFYADEYGPTPAGLDGPIIVVRNRFLDADGNAITTGGQGLPYSMNIFFKAKNKQGLEVTMILDPDTGNGVGFDPITDV